MNLERVMEEGDDATSAFSVSNRYLHFIRSRRSPTSDAFESPEVPRSAPDAFKRRVRLLLARLWRP
jgi:hypothetical protein